MFGLNCTRFCSVNFSQAIKRHSMNYVELDIPCLSRTRISPPISSWCREIMNNSNCECISLFPEEEAVRQWLNFNTVPLGVLVRSFLDNAINYTTRVCLFINEVGEWCWPVFAQTVQLLSVITSLAYKTEGVNSQLSVMSARVTVMMQKNVGPVYDFVVISAFIQHSPVRDVALNINSQSVPWPASSVETHYFPTQRAIKWLW